MKIVIGTVIIFAIGAVAGGLVERSLRPKGCVSERALQGCETEAMVINNMLMECEWNLGDAQHRLIEQMELREKMMKIFMPDRLNGEQ